LRGVDPVVLETQLDQPVDKKSIGLAEHVSLVALLVSFLRLGTSSFGGGMSGWTYREIVERRKWLDDDNFMNTLTIAQILPGANPVNLAVYIGLKLRGWVGAGVAFVGMLAPAFTAILLISLVYEQLSGYPASHTVLRGLACVGIASTLTMGLKTARRLRRQVVPIGIALVVFVTVGVLRWPLIPIVAVSIPVSVLAAFWFKEAKHG
jgi:chromate transporter